MPRVSPLDHLSEHWFIHDNYELRVYEVDSQRAGDVPTFVLIHGIGVSSKYFGPLAERLSEYGRVLLFDLPGFGGVPQPERKLYIEGFASVVRNALDALGVENVVLVGHSMGAQVVVELGIQAPNYSGAIVLVGPIVPVGHRNTRVVLRDFVRSSVHERLPAAMRSIQGYVKAAPKWIATVFPAMLRYPIEHRIKYITGSIAILHGDQDLLCPVDWVEDLASRAEQADVTTHCVPGASHQFVVDHADVIVTAALAISQGSDS